MNYGKSVMLKKIIVIAGLFTSFSVYCQTDSLISIKKVSSNLKLSYNSTFKYPGIRSGIEIPLKHTIKTKTRHSGFQKTINRDFFLSGNLSWYHHPQFHDNLYLTIESILRKTCKHGFYTDYSAGIGYSRTFLGATTYTVDDSGNVSIKKLAGYNYLIGILSMGIGFDFSKSLALPVSIFSKLSVLTMYPYNSIVYMRPTMEIGLIYKPKNFCKIKPKIKTVVK